MESIVTSPITSVAAALVTLMIASRRAGVDEKLAKLRGEFERELTRAKALLDKELAEQKARLDNRTLFAAERVASSLLMHKEWRTRTFRIIKARLGGFADDDLRQILVRAGAIRMSGPDGEERWGLLDRNSDFLDDPTKWQPAAPDSDGKLEA